MPGTMVVAAITLAKKRGRISGRHGYEVYQVPDFVSLFLAELISCTSH